MSDLFFNARSWRAIGLGEQEIKFLEELFIRAGGAPSVTQNLNQVVESVTVIESNTSQGASISSMSRRDLITALNLAQESNRVLEGQLKRLDHRINQLEDNQ